MANAAHAFMGMGDAACPPNVQVAPAAEYHVAVSDRVIKQLKPQFFGFSLEWVGFQEDLWDNQAQKVNPAVISALQAFPGAVYRYPGGTVANYFDWRASVGPQASRPLRRAVDWKGPLATRFGFNEYLNFLKAVGGQAWLVANLYGDFGSEEPATVLSSQAAQWATAARQANANVLRWELGNELDRGQYQWPPERYSARALEIARAIRSADPAARFVNLLEDYDAQRWTSAKSYNTETSRALASLLPDQALHLYYDGPPGGPPVPHRLKHLCASAAAVQAGSGRPATLWLTEHARWPAGKTSDPDWKQNWGSTSNLEGALSVADMVIALSQTPGVEGQFLHSLAGVGGPWPLFHRTGAGLKPSAVYWALRVLREGMLDQVLETRTASRNDSEYAGGYDIRASLMSNAARDKFALWAVNRSGKAVQLKLAVRQLAGRTPSARQVSLADANPNANNALNGQRLLPRATAVTLHFDASGEAWVSLPANSVSALSIDH
ncbi:hypothetical protein [Thiobacillus sedimenti]|uniref:Alpha-L-arabinofuranosidase 1 catalytic domain-containing protein n=1 Tax=Thiobacillus sedimenti TaxID=3110231 RepID=A0ABZ1CGJ7_9PROT|nr:hypothetical protein [Thiobacillus sp. SCUT-2]WRS38331.1 hypothetical protein VA613_09965 [Thiobacillus sp. SCUT-2]